MSNVIKSHYLRDEKFGTDPNTIKAMISMFGDAFFTVGYEKAVNLHAQVAKSPVYFYKYTYCKTTKSYLTFCKNETTNYGKLFKIENKLWFEIIA